jgi:hypothetical protein
MSYMAVEDTLHSHRKTVALFDGPCPGDAIALWTLAGSWSADELMEGFVPRARVRLFGLHKKAASELVRVGFWLEVEGGYRFHEWHERNPTAASVREKRKAGAERVKKYRQRRMSNTDGNAESNAESNALRNPGTNTVTPTVTECVTSSVSHAVGPVRDPLSPLPSPPPDRRRGAQQPARAPEPLPPDDDAGLRRLHATEAASEAADVVHTDRLHLAASGAYGRAMHAAKVIFDGESGWRTEFAAVGRLAARVAERDARDVRAVLAEWAKRYVAERRKRSPKWWLEHVTMWAGESNAEPAAIEIEARRLTAEHDRERALVDAEEARKREAVAPPPDTLAALAAIGGRS